MVHSTRRYRAWLSALMLAAICAAAAPKYPTLTGRVVDNADMLDANSQSRLAAMLAAHEKASHQQIVVVTLPDLGGLSIEKYGYQLGRHWGIGQKKKNNGALLIVAKAEHKVRIEVGYGLEGKLTDAKSSVIIHRIILPAFRQGQFARGITRGTAALIKTLGGNPHAAARPRRRGPSHESPSLLRTLMFFGLLVLVIGFFGGGGGMGGRRRRSRGFFFLPMLLMGGGFGGGRGGGFGGMGGGGFSGGGGGFGGGGASGGW